MSAATAMPLPTTVPTARGVDGRRRHRVQDAPRGSEPGSFGAVLASHTPANGQCHPGRRQPRGAGRRTG